MTDCYFPPSCNYLAPVPTPHRSQLAPETVLKRLTGCANSVLDAMRRGEAVYTDVIRSHGKFLIHRRWVKIGVTFLVIGGKLAEAERGEILRSIGRQMQAVFN